MDIVRKYKTLKSLPWRTAAWAHKRAGVASHIAIAIVAAFFATEGLAVHAHSQQETMCLAEDMYHEGRGEGAENMRLIGKIMIARMLDTDREWPKTICGVVAQDHQNSWVLDYRLATSRNEQQRWIEAQQIARDLLREAENEFTMPEGWECARFYKRTDNKSVTRASLRFFGKKLVPVGSFGNHTAYRERGGCKLPMPTS